jgi:hypothetical protein
MQESQIYQLHMETKYSLHDFVGFIEAENARLKNRIKELEEDLFPMSLLHGSLGTTMPTTTCTPSTNLKGSSSFLTSCRGYVEKNINKIMELITKALETS